MDKGSAEVLARWGVSKILVDLANIPTDPSEESRKQATEQSRQFVQRYGRLRNQGPDRSTDEDYAADVRRWAPVFRDAWRAAITQSGMESVGLALDNIFETNTEHIWDGIAIRTDFANGTWKPIPRDLLDALAIEVISSRKMLHRCERLECLRWFVKSFSRDRYCSVNCGEIMRRQGQYKWVERRREELNKKRRKSAVLKKGKKR